MYFLRFSTTDAVKDKSPKVSGDFEKGILVAFQERALLSSAKKVESLVLNGTISSSSPSDGLSETAALEFFRNLREAAAAAAEGMEEMGKEAMSELAEVEARVQRKFRPTSELIRQAEFNYA